MLPVSVAAPTFPLLPNKYRSDRRAMGSRSPQIMVRPKVYLAAERGVYRSAVAVNGRYPYYAITSMGEALEPWRPRGHETDADVVAGLRAALEQADPPTVTLSLLTPGASASRGIWLPPVRPRPARTSQSPARSRPA